MEWLSHIASRDPSKFPGFRDSAVNWLEGGKSTQTLDLQHFCLPWCTRRHAPSSDGLAHIVEVHATGANAPNVRSLSGLMASAGVSSPGNQGPSDATGGSGRWRSKAMCGVQAGTMAVSGGTSTFLHLCRSLIHFCPTDRGVRTRVTWLGETGKGGLEGCDSNGGAGNDSSMQSNPHPLIPQTFVPTLHSQARLEGRGTEDAAQQPKM